MYLFNTPSFLHSFVTLPCALFPSPALVPASALIGTLGDRKPMGIFAVWVSPSHTFQFLAEVTGGGFLQTFSLDEDRK